MTKKDLNKNFEITAKNLIYQNELLYSELNFLKNLLFNSENFENNEDYCPMCNTFSTFKPTGIVPRPHAACPNCYSVERHRFVYCLFQKRYGSLLKKNINLLHFAPERQFYNYFRKQSNINYFPVDFNPDIYESRGISIRKKVNMEKIPYNNNFFDVIYHSHVLEHVPDDFKAIKETYRVLKKDGVCITVVPQSKIKKTLENEEYNTPELRLKYYGQKDHLRVYGLDFKGRLESGGFDVEEVKSTEFFKTKKERKLYRIPPYSIYVCTK